MTFEYLKVEEYKDSIDIEDIGNCTINIINDDGKEWYLSISTELGWSEIKTFGPLTVDINTLGYSFAYTYNKIEYDSKKLFKIIDKFINDDKKVITEVIELSKDDFIQRWQDIFQQL